MMTEHTPLSFKLPLYLVTWRGRTTIYDDDHKQVASGLALEEAKAIARACNAYPDLVKALQAARGLLSVLATPDDRVAVAIQNQIVDALQKAGIA